MFVASGSWHLGQFRVNEKSKPQVKLIRFLYHIRLVIRNRSRDIQLYLDEGLFFSQI